MSFIAALVIIRLAICLVDKLVDLANRSSAAKMISVSLWCQIGADQWSHNVEALSA